MGGYFDDDPGPGSQGEYGRTRSRGDEPPMLEFNGHLETTTAKAYLFMADNWEKEAWIPKSQSELVEVDHATQRATIRIKAWLCDKNGWSETK